LAVATWDFKKRLGVSSKNVFIVGLAAVIERKDDAVPVGEFAQAVQVLERASVASWRRHKSSQRSAKAFTGLPNFTTEELGLQTQDFFMEVSLSEKWLSAFFGLVDKLVYAHAGYNREIKDLVMTTGCQRRGSVGVGGMTHEMAPIWVVRLFRFFAEHHGCKTLHDVTSRDFIVWDFGAGVGTNAVCYQACGCTVYMVEKAFQCCQVLNDVRNHWSKVFKPSRMGVNRRVISDDGKSLHLPFNEPGPPLLAPCITEIPVTSSTAGQGRRVTCLWRLPQQRRMQW